MSYHRDWSQVDSSIEHARCYVELYLVILVSCDALILSKPCLVNIAGKLYMILVHTHPNADVRT